MTERERLIQLLTEADAKCANTTSCEGCVGFGHGECCTEHLIADHLLANGIIVPPCKVGDILYLPIEHRVIAYEVSKIKYDGDLLKIVTHNKISGLQRTIWAMDVGATIFLSREEAEKALERSRG